MSTRWHLKSQKTATGGKMIVTRKKKAFERGSKAAETKMAPVRKSVIKTMGGGHKISVLSSDVVVVADPKTGKSSKHKIMTVVENSANPHYVRRNIMNKGAVVRTDAGLVKITSRPGQHGALQGVRIEEKK